MKANFRTALAVAALGLLTACASTPRDRSADYARALVGQWEYDYGEPDCPGNASEAYRANGTFTSTSGDCHLDSDGFGHFYYGWYVAREHICVALVEEQWDDEVKRPRFYREKFHELRKRGFVAEDCLEKITRVTPRTITVQRPSGEIIVMKRSRWLY